MDDSHSQKNSSSGIASPASMSPSNKAHVAEEVPKKAKITFERARSLSATTLKNDSALTSPRSAPSHSHRRRATRAASRATSIQEPPPAATTFEDGQIGEGELEAMRQVFDQFDEDKSGSIDAEELYKVMKFIGHELTEHQVLELLEQVDVDGSGTVEFEEFTQMMLLYKEAARFKLNEDMIPAEQTKLKANNIPCDAVPAALWQIGAIALAVYYWLAVLYTDAVKDDDRVDQLLHDQMGVEIVAVFWILADMCISARLNDSSDTTSYISKSYLKRELLPDLLSLLPLHLMVSAGTTQRVLYHFKLIRLLRGIIFYWRESDRVQATRKYVTVHFFVIPLLKAFIGFVSFVHLAAVVYGAVRDSDEATYEKSLYIVTYATTGVGYGTNELKNETTSQRIYAMFLCFCAQALNAAVVGRIATMVMQSDITALKHHEVSHALEVAKIGGFPRPLVHDIVGYREHCVEDSLSEAYKELISNLPTALQSNITLFVKLRMIQNTSLFEFAHRSTQVAIAKELESLIFRPKEIIFSCGQPVSSLYMIAYGYISLYDAQGNCFKTIRAGECFGENGLVFGSEDSTFTAISVNYCELFNLPLLNFQSVLRRFPLFRSKIEAIAKERKEKIDSEVQVSLGDGTTRAETLEKLAEAQDDMMELVGFHSGNMDERVTLQKCMVEIQEIEELVTEIEEKGISINGEGLAMSTLRDPVTKEAVTTRMNLIQSNSSSGAILDNSGSGQNQSSASAFSGMMPTVPTGPGEHDVVVEDTTSVEGDMDHIQEEQKTPFHAFAEASDGEEVMSSGFPSGTNIVEGQFGNHGTIQNLDAGGGAPSSPSVKTKKGRVRSHSGEAVTLRDGDGRQNSATVVEDFEDEQFYAGGDI